MDWLRRFPLRKFIGFVSGCLTGVFSISFLLRTLYTGEAVPDGVVPLLGVLGGVFGGYVGSSSMEAISRKNSEGDGIE